MVRKIFIIILFTIYIYSIKFTFLPITGKQVIELLGFALFFVNRERFNYQIYKKVIILCIILFFWGLIVALISGSFQLIYIEPYLIAPLASFFGAYFLYFISKKYICSFYDLLKIIALVVFLESLLTVVMHFSPSVYSLMAAIQEFLLHEDHLGNFADINRFTGIGTAAYFGVLPSCAMGVMACVYLMSHSDKKINTITYLLFFITILSVSFLVSRTSLLLSGVSLLVYILYMNRKNSAKVLFTLSLIALFVFGIVSLAFYYLPDNILIWATAAFNTDSSNSSTVGVLEWWTTTHFSLSTFLFGDGLYTTSAGYYMETDIGYFRQIYYGGIVGLSLIIGIHYSILNKVNRLLLGQKMKLFLFGLFVCYLLSMAKGDVSMIDMFILLLVFADYNINSKVAKRNLK